MQAGGQECPPHTVSSYLNPQQFLENKSCNYRQDEEQPNPVHTIAGDLDIAIRVIDRNGLDRTIFRQRRLSRRNCPRKRTVEIRTRSLPTQTAFAAVWPAAAIFTSYFPSFEPASRQTI